MPRALPATSDRHFGRCGGPGVRAVILTSRERKRVGGSAPSRSRLVTADGYQGLIVGCLTSFPVCSDRVTDGRDELAGAGGAAAGGSFDAPQAEHFVIGVTRFVEAVGVEQEGIARAQV